MAKLVDSYGRYIDYLRISITDRCNLDCLYCTPFGGRSRLSHAAILSYEEIVRVAKAAVLAGISKVRITGGEPLQRKGMARLCRMLSNIEGLESLTLTTNGVLLEDRAQSLFEAGVRRINVSLDTLKPDRFRNITGRNFLPRVLNGIKRAEAVGFFPVKINTVVMKGINDDEIADFARLTIENPYHVRFIELMPTAGRAYRNQASLFMPVEEIVKRVKNAGNLLIERKSDSYGPARLCAFKGGVGKVGFIAPMSWHFCGSCNRLRLTADGKIRACLFSENEIDIKAPLRVSASMEDLVGIFRLAAQGKPRRHTLNHDICLNSPGRAMRAIGG